MAARIISVILGPIVNGIFWAIGAAVGDALLRTRIKDGIGMLARKHFLFHPKVTLTAGLVGFASFCTLIAGLALPLHKISFIAPYTNDILGIAGTLGPIALWVATYGRSPASAVDNNTPAP